MASVEDRGQQPPSWEDVLAAFMTQVESAEALLEPSGVVGGVGAVGIAAANPAVCDVWALGLPALPEDLGEQARALYARQQQLISRLQDEMDLVRLQQGLLEAPAGPRQSVFVDRRA